MLQELKEQFIIVIGKICVRSCVKSAIYAIYVGNLGFLCFTSSLRRGFDVQVREPLAAVFEAVRIVASPEKI